VRRFYTHWKEFTSRKKFGWAEKYNLNQVNMLSWHLCLTASHAQAPNRDVRRAMERENKKLRDDKKKEFVQCVRVSET
jgi:DnaJ family protein A protein 5